MLHEETIILPRIEKTFLREGKMVIRKHPWQVTILRKTIEMEETIILPKTEKTFLREGKLDKLNLVKEETKELNRRRGQII